MHKSCLNDWKYVDPLKPGAKFEKCTLGFINWAKLTIVKIAVNSDIPIKELIREPKNDA